MILSGSCMVQQSVFTYIKYMFTCIPFPQWGPSKSFTNNDLLLQAYVHKDQYGIRDLLRVGYTLQRIYFSGYFSLRDFRDARITVKELPPDINVRNLREAGYTALEVLNGGHKIYHMMDGGYTTKDLVDEIPLSTLKNLGVPAHVLAQNERGPNDLQKAGYSKKDIIRLLSTDLPGYTPAALNKLGIPMKELEKHYPPKQYKESLKDLASWWVTIEKNEKKKLQLKRCFGIICSLCFLSFIYY